MFYFIVFYSIYEAISIKSPLSLRYYIVLCRRQYEVYMQKVDKSIHLYTFVHAGCWTGDTISVSRRNKVFIYSLLNSFLQQQCRRNNAFIYLLLNSFLHQQCRRNNVFIYSLLNSFLQQHRRRNNVFVMHGKIVSYSNSAGETRYSIIPC